MLSALLSRGGLSLTANRLSNINIEMALFGAFLIFLGIVCLYLAIHGAPFLDVWTVKSTLHTATSGGGTKAQ